MTAQALPNPLPTFTGLDGRPLSDGYVYFGLIGQDPRQYPKAVFFDQALTIPAAQPVRTTAGYLYRNGAPTNLWVDGDCSVLVLDAQLRQVFFLAEWVSTASAAAAAAAAAAQPYVDAAELASEDAQAAQAAAEVARDAALAAARIYATTAAGLAATSSGQYFYVPSTDANESLILYLNSAGSAVEQKRYPAAPLVTNLNYQVQSALGPDFAVGAEVTFGDTTPNTTTYPLAGFPSLGPNAVFAASGYLSQVSVRLSAIGTGEIHIYTPDPTSPRAYRVAAVVAVSLAAGVNVIAGSTLYAKPLPAGTRIHYRGLTGGSLRYVAGGVGSYVDSTGAQTAGNILSGQMTPDPSLTLGMAFKVIPIVATSLDSRLDDLEAGKGTKYNQVTAAVGASLNATLTKYGDETVVKTGDLTTGGNFVYSVGTGLALYGGVLETVTIPCGNPLAIATTSVFAAQLAVLNPTATAGVYTVSKLFTVYLSPGVTNTLSGFGDAFVQAGGFVAVTQFPAQAVPTYTSSTTSKLGTGVLAEGGTITMGVYANTAIGSYQIRETSAALAPRVDTLGQEQDLLRSGTNPVSQVSTRFAGVSLPTGWTQNGGWTVSDGLIAPGAGGWDVVALSPNYSSISRRKFEARVQVNNAASIFGICASPQEANGGGVAMVDGAAGKLRIYSWDGTSAAGTFVSEVALPAALTVGREYLLTLDKNGLVVTATFTDSVTQQTCTISENQASGFRMFHGKPGIMFRAGAIKVKWMGVSALYQRYLKAIILGDSIVEGSDLPVGSYSWAWQLQDTKTGDKAIMVAGRSGDETPNFAFRKTLDLYPWRPKYVLLALGTNDTDQPTWRTNIAAAIVEIVARGGEPILCTQVPRTASQALRTAMNADIRALYFGNYRYIDFAIAVSNAHDGVTWDPAYDLGDGTHPNAAGQAKMYQQALIDAPFLAD